MAAGLPSGTSAATAAAALDAAAAAGAGRRGSCCARIPTPTGPWPTRRRAAGPRPWWPAPTSTSSAVTAPCPRAARRGSTARTTTARSSRRPYTAAAGGRHAGGDHRGRDRRHGRHDRPRPHRRSSARCPGRCPGSVPSAAAEASSRLTQVSRMVNLALAFTLVIAGCGLAVAVAGGIIERKRPFALLRLSGMHLAELRRVALLEAAAPLLLIALASAVLGLGDVGRDRGPGGRRHALEAAGRRLLGSAWPAASPSPSGWRRRPCRCWGGPLPPRPSASSRPRAAATRWRTCPCG